MPKRNAGLAAFESAVLAAGVWIEAREPDEEFTFYLVRQRPDGHGFKVPVDGGDEAQARSKAALVIKSLGPDRG